ncbi:MAG: SctK family type III secretion system sorting platform protein [Bordetella sp.]|uniref:SctK family type III secretion system sorting platform protein n=1 Tax=Bordetella sp. TaxID=28081 RepID=UPI003F7CB41A
MMDARALFGARLVEFNLLPSRTLHPSRYAEYGAPAEPVPAELAPAWHRHWSNAILRKLGLQSSPVRDCSRPELALALLPGDRLARCARLLGATLCAPRLRRVIAGADVRRLLEGLGPDALDFARQSNAVLPAGMQSGDALDAQGVDSLGHAVMLEALRGGGPELVLRAELRLAAGPAAKSPCSPAQALDLALSVLKISEPTWHSSFLATR